MTHETSLELVVGSITSIITGTYYKIVFVRDPISHQTTHNVDFYFFIHCSMLQKYTNTKIKVLE